MGQTQNTFHPVSPPGRLRPASGIENACKNKPYVLPRMPNLDVITDVSKLSIASIMEKYPAYFTKEIICDDEILEVDDIYNANRRMELLNAPISASLQPLLRERRVDFFRNGFNIDLQTNEAASKNVSEYRRKYSNELIKMDRWCDKCELEKEMRNAYDLWVTQGRFACEIRPPLAELGVDELPFMCRNVPAEDTHNPIINIKTEQILAIKITDIGSNGVDLLSDAMVYGRRYAEPMETRYRFHGRSAIEDLSQMVDEQANDVSALAANFNRANIESFRSGNRSIRENRSELARNAFELKREEKRVIQCFEEQLLTPLLSHLTGIPVQYLPVKAVVQAR